MSTKIDKKSSKKGSLKEGVLNGNYTEWFSNGQKKLLSNIKMKKYYIDQTGTGMVSASINYQNLLKEKVNGYIKKVMKHLIVAEFMIFLKWGKE